MLFLYFETFLKKLVRNNEWRNVMGEIIDFNKAFAQKKDAEKKKSISKKKITSASKSNSFFIFKVTLREGFMNQKLKHETFRVLSIPNLFTLSKFANVILESYEFELDHMYGFYDNLNNWAQSDEFYVMEEEENPGNCNGFVNQVTVSEVFNRPEKKMLFVFDFGDEWKFTVEYLKQENPEGKVKLAASVIESVGDAPPQYPDFEA
jgi:hypothetical protein